jgi:hypothetical protein
VKTSPLEIRETRGISGGGRLSPAGRCALVTKPGRRVRTISKGCRLQAMPGFDSCEIQDSLTEYMGHPWMIVKVVEWSKFCMDDEFLDIC